MASAGMPRARARIAAAATKRRKAAGMLAHLTCAFLGCKPSAWRLELVINNPDTTGIWHGMGPCVRCGRECEGRVTR